MASTLELDKRKRCPASSTTANGVQLNGPGSGTNYLQLRPVGKVINASTAYSWNVTIGDIMGPGNSIIPTGMTTTQNPTIQYVLPGDIIFGTTPSIAPGVLSLRGTPKPYTVWTIKPSRQQQRQHYIWKKTYDAPSGNMTRQPRST